MDLTWNVLHLSPQRPFKISRGVTTSFPVVVAELRHDGHVGYGEAAPSRSVTGETPETVAQFLSWAAGELAGLDPEEWEGFLDAMHSDICGNNSARTAVDLAVHDLVGKLKRVPARRLYGLPDAGMVTTMTVSLDDPHVMAEEAREYQRMGFKALKVKLGARDGHDADRLMAVRTATNLPLRVDANEAWTPEEAKGLLPILEDASVEMIEQPTPRADLRALADLQKATSIPLYADEPILDIHDVRRAIDAGLSAPGGVNLKLMKTGGLRPAIQAARLAREHGLGVMAGCNLESSCGIAAAAQTIPLLRFADLDGNLLLQWEPFEGVPLADGLIGTPPGHGLGIRPRQPPAA